MNTQMAFLLGGSSVIFLWGVGHVIATRNVVSDFGLLSMDNKKIITMEWLAEGLTLCFLGILVGLVTLVLGPDVGATRLVVLAVSAMLFVLAGLSAFTGARSAILPMKMCPFVKSAVALGFVVASLL